MNPKLLPQGIRSDITLRYMGSASDKTSEKVPPEVSESLCPVDDTISTGLALYRILIFILHIGRGAMVTAQAEPSKLPGISWNLFIVLLLLIVGGAIERSAIATRFEIQGMSWQQTNRTWRPAAALARSIPVFFNDTAGERGCERWGSNSRPPA
jgi:hypothetical protein